ARVVAEDGHRERDVDPRRVADRLPAVEGLELGDLLRLRLDQVRELPEDLAPIRARHLRPRTLVEGLARRADRGLDVGLGRLGDVRDRLLGRGVDGRERGARGRVAPLAADEQLARLDHAISDEKGIFRYTRDGSRSAI